MKRQEISAERKNNKNESKARVKQKHGREMMYDVDGPIIRPATDKKITNETVNRSIIITQIETEREEKNNRTYAM